MKRRCGIQVVMLLASALLAGGCASPAGSGSAARPRVSAPTSQRVNPNASLTLDEILPRPSLAAVAAPSTGPSRPPLDAVQLYARARAAMIDGQRYGAVNLLEKAIKLDPNSFELYYAMGQAQMIAGATVQAIEAFEKAAAISPDNLQLQYELGRQHLGRGDAQKAIEHLRLAKITRKYREDDDTAALVDYFLARALQEKGYYRAALDCYALLMKRLERAVSSHASLELLYLRHHPDALHAQIGELHERRGDYAAARDEFEKASSLVADNFEYQAHIVRARLKSGDADGAAKAAAAAVTAFHVSADALELLKETYRAIHNEPGAAAVLASLHAKQPGDRWILLSYADLLKWCGKQELARKILHESLRTPTANPSSPGRYDMEIVKRLFAMYQDDGATESSAKLLVEVLAHQPDSLSDLGTMWAQMLHPPHGGRLRITMLQKLDVPADSQSARLFWISRMAEIWNRDLLAQSTLEQSAACTPAFGPAYRSLCEYYWRRPEWNDAQKAKAVEDLVGRARSQGATALAEQIRGLSLLRNRDYASAAKAFGAARQLGDNSADAQLFEVTALLRDTQYQKAVDLLLKITRDFPHNEEAYATLFSYYMENKQLDRGEDVLRRWLEADPGSVTARRLDALIAQSRGQFDHAQTVLLNLFAEHGDDIQVISSLKSFYDHTDRASEFVGRLEEERVRHPDNRTVVEALVQLYASGNKMTDCARVLDATRAAVSKDPDLLYWMAHLYELIERRDLSEAVLQQVLEVDPRHAPANNDLGYFWTEEGKNLDRAEKLIHIAIDEEPDNQSYLDSMGWVSYKRGKFQQAREYLDKAIGPATLPDPVVLDHLGDVLYRLSKAQDAVAQWKRSLQRLSESDTTRPDLKNLRELLLKKLKQQEKGEPVQVAPAGEEKETKPAGGAVHASR